MLALIRKISLHQRRRLAILVSLILLSNVLEGFGISLVLPVFQRLLHQEGAAGGLGRLINQIVAGLGLTPTLINILVLLNIAFVLKTALSVFAKYYSTWISAQYMGSFQTRLFETLLNANLASFHREKQGKFVNALTTEMTRTSNAFVLVASWISALLTAVLYFAIAIKISVKLAVISMILGAICLTPLRMISRRASGYGFKWTSLNEGIQSLLTESISGIKYIKASAYETESLRQFKLISDDYKQNWAKVAFNSGLASLFAQPIAIFILSVLLYLSVSLSVSLPELFVFLLALLRILPTLTGMSAFRADINANISALDRIEEIRSQAEREKEKTGKTDAPLFGKSIEIKNLNFQYAGSPLVIENLSWTVPFGQVVAIVGRSGGGKTTLVDLILGLYEPKSGSILVDGVDLSSIALSRWRSQVAYVSQETFLFHDTVRNNIALSKPDATFDEIKEAAQMADAHEFILSLENGYETIVGDRGSKLSGGQKQRIALARALLKKPRLLILDEATSALDSASEKSIRKTIHHLKEARKITVILIAHRMSTVEEADQVFNIEKAKVDSLSTLIRR